MFEVIGYDKDNDVYDVLYKCYDALEANTVLLIFTKLLDGDRILSSVDREPYDSISVYKDGEPF